MDSSGQFRDGPQHLGRIDPDVEVLAHVQEAHHAVAVQDVGGGMRHSGFDGFGVLLAQAERVDGCAALVAGEADAAPQPELVEEADRLRVHLVRCHHVDHDQVVFAFEGVPQLHEPRLGVGSPVDAALEGEQHAMAEQIGKPDRASVEIDEREVGHLLGELRRGGGKIVARGARAAPPDVGRGQCEIQREHGCDGECREDAADHARASPTEGRLGRSHTNASARSRKAAASPRNRSPSTA